MVKRGRSKKYSGGEGANGRPMSGGAPLGSSPYNTEGAPLAKSNYYTISGGSRKKRSHKRRRSQRNKKGGEGVLATAAVPFGLLALQRYFKGSKTSKQGVARMGNSVRRTFRRRRL
jgi:hypothetical protein